MFGMGGMPGMQQEQGMGSSIPGLGDLFNARGAGADPGGYTAFGPGGGMDVMGSLQKHSNFGTQFQRNAGAGPMTGGFGV